MTAEHDTRFRCMGTEVRLLIGEPLEAGTPSPAAAAGLIRTFLEDFDMRLSRFRPASELCRLNGDPRATVPVSGLMLAAVRAALWAAERTGGLVDPTLVGEIERAGYDATRDGVQPASLADALACAPRRAPAAPHPAARWASVGIDEATRTVHRPPGVRFDTGGSGKGLAADMVAGVLSGYSRFLVDCGGDMRAGGPALAGNPYRVEVAHPLGRDNILRLPLAEGAIATSGIGARIWQSPGSFFHHLLDPSTGEPAWTGLVAATALGRTTLEAETLAKAALLSGPRRAGEWLARHGGVLVNDDGGVQHVGIRVTTPARLRFRLPDRRAA